MKLHSVQCTSGPEFYAAMLTNSFVFEWPVWLQLILMHVFLVVHYGIISGSVKLPPCIFLRV